MSGTVRRLLAILEANVVRTTRDRQGLFFILVLPLILIVVLGMTYGGQGAVRIGVVVGEEGPLATALVDEIAASPGVQVELRRFGSADELRDAAARGIVSLGIVVPAGYDRDLREGRVTALAVVAPPTTVAGAVRSTVTWAIAHQAAVVRAARFVAAAGEPFDAALSAARAGEARAPGVAVETTSVARATTAGRGFDLGAQSQVILFMFLTSLTGATELITTRQLGISRRMFATPTGPWTIIAGEGLARIAVALLQGVFIVVASAALFGVEWPDPAATGAIIVAFGLVSAGAALLVGTLAANPSQAGALGPALGMLLGLVGGTMVPADVFPDVMRTLSHVAPHAWAMDAFRTLRLDGGGLGAVLPDVGVLVGFAAVLFGLAVVRFRHELLAGR